MIHVDVCCFFCQLLIFNIGIILLDVLLCRLKLVLPWMMTGFSGVISVEQLLMLWDFIIGYDSLEILPC